MSRSSSRRSTLYWSSIAENVVAALLDINENQIYQSSRRYLTHAVIGAIAIAMATGTIRTTVRLSTA